MSDVSPARLSTGIAALDEQLGGGLLPGTMTVVLGATGVGKTQLGLHFAAAGFTQERRGGVVYDLSARGDSQSHAEYARRLFDWALEPAAAFEAGSLHDFFAAGRRDGDYLHMFDRVGRRVTRADLDWDALHDWQAEINRKLSASIAFLYGNFVRGARRVVFDGVEPADRPGDSIQFDLLESIYHQVVRKDPQWVARDLFRQHYRAHAEMIARHTYDPRQVACMVLVTSREAMLEDLICRRLDEGDLLAGCNTLLYLGRLRDGDRLGRGLYIAKHRGSAAGDAILRYRITASGLQFEAGE